MSPAFQLGTAALGVGGPGAGWQQQFRRVRGNRRSPLAARLERGSLEGASTNDTVVELSREVTSLRHRSRSTSSPPLEGHVSEPQEERRRAPAPPLESCRGHEVKPC